MEDNYTYPAVISKEDGELVLSFPDFPDIMETGNDMQTLISDAQESLALTLIDLQDRKKKIPSPSEIRENAVFVNIWLPYFKNRAKEIYVRKSVTIPQWLDILAKEKDINFSAAMVRGIKEELGIAD